MYFDFSFGVFVVRISITGLIFFTLRLYLYRHHPDLAVPLDFLFRSGRIIEIKKHVPSKPRH